MGVINLKSSDFSATRGALHITHPATRGVPGMLFIWADWCPHCHSFIPKYKKIAQYLGEEFKCVAIEHKQFENNTALTKALDFEHFPTLKFFDQNGKVMASYPSNQPREIEPIMKYICQVYHHCTMYH